MLFFPYFKELCLNLSWLYIPFAVVVISGTSNAVNLSDGLDGLASGLMIIALTVFLAVAYCCGLPNAVDYNMFFIPRSGEIAVVCAALIGACLGFLYFNKPKAKVFMGDTGSLTLGGIIAVFAILIRKELLIPLLCLIFFLEDLSVIMQVAYFKYTKRKYGEGRRIFKMT